ncbi:hypothetical protein DFH09DRAFT_1451801 [Mycena vulgaris]|nr:hypothetical protein DFH09DRAFT_1451801 [Mycena vulgaris]
MNRVPFTRIEQFYPGVFVWCDPQSAEMDLSTQHNPPAPSQPPVWSSPQHSFAFTPRSLAVYQNAYPRAPPPAAVSRGYKLRPCLIVSVDRKRGTFTVAGITSSPPADMTKWIELTSHLNPKINWDCAGRPRQFMWMGEPVKVLMVFNNATIMCPHDRPVWSQPPISTSNLASYAIHREQFRLANLNTLDVQLGGNFGANFNQSAALGTTFNTPGANVNVSQSAFGVYTRVNHLLAANSGSVSHEHNSWTQSANPYNNAPYDAANSGSAYGGGHNSFTQTGTTYYNQPGGSGHANHNQSGGSDSTQPPFGFFRYPDGTVRNPTTGQFWHQSYGAYWPQFP